MGVLDKLLRAGEGKKLKALQGLVPDINALEPEMEALSDDELQAKTAEFRQRLDNGEDLDDLLIEAFAVVREAASRTIGQRHYDVQLMGGAALHFGWVAEMKTGEGKTLVSTLPVYLNGLDRQGRARHHGERLPGPPRRRVDGPGPPLAGPHGRPDPPRRLRHRATSARQYACDITYGTNNEFGFDYLRDNMAMTQADKVQRGHDYAIVDEVDSILIDEARTPLIISGRVADAAKLYYKFASIVRGLQARRRLRRRRGEAHGRAHRGGHRARSSRRSASTTCTTSVSAEPRAPAPGRAARPRSSTSGTRTTSSSTAR